MEGTLQKEGLSWCSGVGWGVRSPASSQVIPLASAGSPADNLSAALRNTEVKGPMHIPSTCGLGGLTDLLLTQQAPCGLRVPCTHQSLDPSAHLGSQRWSSAFLLNAGGWPIAWLAIPKNSSGLARSEEPCFLRAWPHLLQWDLHLPSLPPLGYSPSALEYTI